MYNGQNMVPMAILCYLYPNSPEEVYRKSLHIDVVLQVAGIVCSVCMISANSEYVVFVVQLVLSIIFLCWAGYLLKHIPTPQHQLSQSLKSSASRYVAFKIVWGWIALVGTPLLLVLVSLVTFSMMIRENTSKDSDLGVGVVLLVVLILNLPSMAVSFQN